MDMRIPPLKIKILLESDPPKSIILVRRLAVEACRHTEGDSAAPEGLLRRGQAADGDGTARGLCRKRVPN